MSDSGKAVFLSYASQDAEAAKRIADALRAAGVEVWFDTDGGLEHGDEWDAKIRRQIKECVLFIPLISANTQAREEGYFRLEWDLAAERARTIASGVAFILPVVIDDTREPAALVPDRFRTVQWTKLPGGQVPADVLQRLLKLWSHRAGLVKQQHAEQEAGRPQPVAPEPAGPRWLKPVLASSALIIAGLAITLWQKSRTPERLEPPVAPVAPAVSASSPSPTPVAPEARDWPKDPELKKAMALTEGLEAIPDDLALAEEIAKRALDRSPTDVEAVTVMARIQSHFLRRGFDRSDERAALAKRYSERALQLAPDEPEAMYALATYHFSRVTGETARTEQLLRRAMELDPTNPRPGRLLADLYNATNRQTEAITQGQDNVRRFPRDVLSHYDLARNFKDQGRYTEFDRELDATLVLAPLPNAIVWKARLQFGLRNDLAGMKAWLDRVPTRVRGTERAVFGYFLYAAFGGDPETGLEALRDFPQKWFTDFEYAGPTALLNASLLELQGKQELARRQYEVALGEIQRMRQTDPGRIGLSQVEFWTMLGLGRLDEAKASHRRVVEGSRRPYAQDMVNGWWFTVIPGSLLIGDRTTALTLLRESVEARPESRAAFRLRFQIDPRMAPFRDDPEISALLRDPADQRTVGREQKTVPAADPKSVAVLAFANLSDDKENEYFSDGISEELLTVLQKIPGLKVSARTSAFSFKGKNATAQEIGRTLGVAHLVEGSVRKAGAQVRITARLSRTDTGEQLWSENYTRDVKDVFAVQTELAQTILAQLQGRLGGAAARTEIAAQVEAAEKGGTHNAEAHELYLQGKYFIARNDLADAAHAAELLQRAVALDPQFALAWAALSSAGQIQGGYAGTSKEMAEGFDLARRAADRAIALEPALAAGHVARFDLQSSADFDWKGAAVSLRRAQQLDPDEPAVVYRAATLAYTFGDLGRADELTRRALALDPVNAGLYIFQGYLFLAMHRFAEAETAFQHVVELSPGASWSYAGVAMARTARGNPVEAERVAEQSGSEWSRLYTLTLARAGRKDEAATEPLEQLIKKFADVAAYQIACAYAYRGDKDQAFAWLERAYRQHDPGLSWGKSDFFLEKLRSDPRWPEFMHKLGLADDQLKP